MTTLAEKEDPSALLKTIGSKAENIGSDNAFGEKMQRFDAGAMETLSARDAEYANLLTTYSIYTDLSLMSKLSKQTIFFWGCSICAMASIVFFCAYTWFGSNNGNYVTTIAALGEVVAAIIVFPRIIAKYLFDRHDLSNVRKIVGKVQDFDIGAIKGIRDSHPTRDQ